MSWPWQHWLTFIPGGSNRYESARSAETQLNPWVRKITWRREQPPTPVFLPGEFHGQRGLVGYSPWGRKEVDTTEQLTVSLTSRLSRGFPGGAVVRNLPANAGDAGDSSLIPGSGRSPKVGNGNPLQCSCIENSMDRGTWLATVHGIAKSWTWLNTHTGIHNTKPTNLFGK